MFRFSGRFVVVEASDRGNCILSRQTSLSVFNIQMYTNSRLIFAYFVIATQRNVSLTNVSSTSTQRIKFLAATIAPVGL